MTDGLRNKKKFTFMIIGVILFILFSTQKPFTGLTPESMKCLGVFFCAICFWIGDVFPFFVTCLGLFCGLVLSGGAGFNTAFQGFSSSIFCFMLGAMGISVALEKCGLMKRIALLIMKLFSPTFKGQSLGLLISGLLINPIVPSVTAKTAMVMPFSKGIADSMGYEPHSKGMHGIYIAAFCGITLGSFAFYTSNFFAIVVRGLMPEEAQHEFTFIPWMFAAIPWIVVTFLCLGIMINILYKPEAEQKGLSKEHVINELAQLGKLSRNEIISIIILSISVLIWMLENQLGLPAHVVAVAAAVLLLMLKVISVEDFICGVSWNMLIVIGVLIGLSNVFGEVGINDYVAKLVSPLVELVAGNIFIFLTGMTILIYIMRFFLTSQMAALPIFMSIFLPACAACNISPWVCAFVSLTSSGVWNVLYQNTLAMQAYAAYEGEKNIQYKLIARSSICYMLINIFAITASVPIWKLMGLV